MEYDPSSQWFNASLTIAAEWLKTQGEIIYGVYSQPPENIPSQLNQLGVDTKTLESDNRLQIADFYTITLGQKSKEKYAPYDSLKISDMSIKVATDLMRRPPAPQLLRIVDNESCLARFKDEKIWVEYLLTRILPIASIRKSTGIRGVITGIHSSWAYKQLESAADGIVDFKIDDSGEETRNMIRIRTMRNVGFDTRRHRLKIGENFEVTLEK